jgi:hypothetical protein
MTVNGPMTRPDRVATLEEAKAWKAWAKLEERLSRIYGTGFPPL